MIDVNSTLHDWLSRNSTTSTSNYSKSDNGSKIIIFSLLSVILIIVLSVIYCVCYEIFKNKKQKNHPQSRSSRSLLSLFPIDNGITSNSRRVSSIYIVPVRSGTITDSRGVSSIYPVLTRSNTISVVKEELPPSYHTVISLEENELNTFTRV